MNQLDPNHAPTGSRSRGDTDLTPIIQHFSELVSNKTKGVDACQILLPPSPVVRAFKHRLEKANTKTITIVIVGLVATVYGVLHH